MTDVAGGSATGAGPDPAPVLAATGPPAPRLSPVAARRLRDAVLGPAPPAVVVLPVYPHPATDPALDAGGPAGPAPDAAAPTPGADLDPRDADLLASFGVDAARRLRRARATGRAGEVVTVDLERDRPEQVLLVGVAAGTPADLRRAGAAIARRLGSREDAAVLGPADAAAPAVEALAEGLLLGSYAFRVRRDPPPERPAAVAVAAGPAGAAGTAALRRAEVTATAVRLARDLANTPANRLTPADLADRAVAAAGAAGLRVRVRSHPDLAAEGFGGLLAVGAGSVHPPRLVEIGYAPRGATRHVVLVGKGITFDSGGLSLKPADAMTTMKTDMAGAAAVLAVATALPALRPRLRVTALLALAENLPGAAALRPGDVVRHWGGRTSEVLNTDAEGRLVLADALAYADRTLRPDVMVDVATLTGAATLALGRGMAALLATSDRLATALARAGEEAGEPVWRLPLVDDYVEALASPVADVAHVPRDRRVGGGAITAGLYLRGFVGDRPWAHLDIAGPARAEADRDEVTRGGTGFGTRLLLRWLRAGAPG